MSIIRTVLNEYQLTGNIADFLQQLQTKAQTLPQAAKKRSEKPSVSTSWTAY